MSLVDGCPHIEESDDSPKLSNSIDELGLSDRVSSKLKHFKIFTISDLLGFYNEKGDRISDVIPGVGRVSVEEIKNALRTHGLLPAKMEEEAQETVVKDSSDKKYTLALEIYPIREPVVEIELPFDGMSIRILTEMIYISSSKPLEVDFINGKLFARSPQVNISGSGLTIHTLNQF